MNEKEGENQRERASMKQWITPVPRMLPPQGISSLEDKTMAAELRETVAMAEHDFSMYSCSHNTERYKIQFPDSGIAEKFSIKRTKLTYLAVEAIAPYVKKELGDVGPYSISYDEVSNILLVYISLHFIIIACDLLCFVNIIGRWFSCYSCAIHVQEPEKVNRGFGRDCKDA